MISTFSPSALADKTILITGASSGIGQQTAVALASCGARLIIHGRDSDRLESCRNSLPHCGHTTLSCDLSNSEDIADFVSKLPKLDGVVFNAGIVKWGMVKFQNMQDLDEIFNVNFKSVVMLQQLLLAKRKINKNASLVYVSSYAATRASIAQGAYAASKSALRAYARSVALELAPQKIRANTIFPAMVDTNILGKGVVQSEDIKNIIASYPLKRIGQPDDIASLITFLLSDASSWITGSEILIDGGASLV